MSTIRVAWGRATGPTAMASYDAALAAAGVHEYNLVSVSSVVPAGAAVEAVGTAPDLGPVGDRLFVVQGHRTVPPDADEPSVAGLGWVRGDDGAGVFYETDGRDAERVRETIRAGLDHGASLRGWSPVEREIVLRGAEPRPDAHATAVVLAAYGRSEPIV